MCLQLPERFDNAAVRHAKFTDIFHFSKVMRPVDQKELLFRFGIPVKLALFLMYRSHTKGNIYSVTLSGRTHGMFGVQAGAPNVGVPWFLSSDELIDSNRRRFIRESKKWLEVLSQNCDVLENHILAENKVHIRWIESLGFELTEYHERYGAAKKPFWKFRKVIVEP